MNILLRFSPCVYDRCYVDGMQLATPSHPSSSRTADLSNARSPLALTADAQRLCAPRVLNHKVYITLLKLRHKTSVTVG